MRFTHSRELFVCVNSIFLYHKELLLKKKSPLWEQIMEINLNIKFLCVQACSNLAGLSEENETAMTCDQ